MKTVFAIFALLAVTCYAAPALEKSKTLKYDQPLTKGEAHMHNAVEPESKFWIPFWDYVSGWFSQKQELPTSNNEVKMAKAVDPTYPPTYLPNLNKEDFADSHEFLEEMSNQLFDTEESRELKEVHSEEARFMHYKTPEHVRDAVIHDKVDMPKRADYDDYGDFLEKTSHSLLGRAEKAKPKSLWDFWGWWVAKNSRRGIEQQRIFWTAFYAQSDIYAYEHTRYPLAVLV